MNEKLYFFDVRFEFFCYLNKTNLKKTWRNCELIFVVEMGNK